MKYIITLTLLFLTFCTENPVEESYTRYAAEEFTSERVYKIFRDSLISSDTINNILLYNETLIADQVDKSIWEERSLSLYDFIWFTSINENPREIEISKSKIKYLDYDYKYEIKNDSCYSKRMESTTICAFYNINFKISNDTLFLASLLKKRSDKESHFLNVDISVDDLLSKAKLYFQALENGEVDTISNINDTLELRYYDIKFYIAGFSD